MSAANVTSGHRRLGSLLVAVGMVVALLSAVALIRPAGAASTVLVEDDAISLALAVSQAKVPDADAGGVLLVDHAMPPATWSAPAALATMPGQGALLLTRPATLDATVAAEVERVLAPNGVVYVLGMPAVEAAARARGWTVVSLDLGDPVATSVALADQTWGVLAGTTQRLLAVAAVDGAHLLAGAANVHGTNLAIPVVALGEGQSVDIAPTVLREVIAVGASAAVPDGAVSSGGSPSLTRVDGAPADVAATLAQAMEDDPKDGLLEPRLGRTVVAVEVDEDRPQPALLASVVAARDSLDGFDAAIAFVDRAADVAALDAGNGATFLGLTRPGEAPAPAPAPAPLPATGGGLVVGAVLVLVGVRLRRPTT